MINGTAAAAANLCLRVDRIALRPAFALLDEDLYTQLDTVVADVHAGSCDQPLDLGLGFAAERALRIFHPRFLAPLSDALVADVHAGSSFDQRLNLGLGLRALSLW